MRHGYTNSTELCPGGVRKSYAGPDALLRARAEYKALIQLAGVMPVPRVLDRHPDGTIVTEFRPGEHGQDLIESGRPDQVLAACGTLLNRLHALSPDLLIPGAHPPTHVIVHGDFGPNNMLLDPDDFTVTALLDWEFSGVGPAVTDLAWCEWIVRMHHPAAVRSLPKLFDSYGWRPAWEERQHAMIQRCRWLQAFTQRWDPHGEGARVWVERVEVTAAWGDES